MTKAPTTAFWFIKDGDKLIQCRKEAFDQAIAQGKSVRYNGYADRKSRQIAERLEQSRMAFLADPCLPAKLRAALTDPANVCEVEVIQVDDPEFWQKESKRAKYRH